MKRVITKVCFPDFQTMSLTGQGFLSWIGPRKEQAIHGLWVKKDKERITSAEIIGLLEQGKKRKQEATRPGVPNLFVKLLGETTEFL